MAFTGGTAERDEWPYAQAVGVGPLRFGMTVDDVVEAAGPFGRTTVSECVRDHEVFSPTRKIEIHRAGVTPSPPAVTAYVSQAAGLFCIAVDAVHGPQVAYDGLPLVGRDMSELERDVVAWSEATDMCFGFTPEGYVVPYDPGLVMRGQPVGQTVLSRPLFMVTRDGANTEWDSMPSEERRIDGQPAA